MSTQGGLGAAIHTPFRREREVLRGFGFQGIITVKCSDMDHDVIVIDLHHNAHFRDIGRRFRHPLTPFLTALAPRGARDREPQCLGSCSAMPTESGALTPPSLPHPTYPPCKPLLHAQNIASPKWPATTYALGPIETAACTSQGPLQLQNMGALPLHASLFPPVLRQSATHLTTRPFIS